MADFVLRTQVLNSFSPTWLLYSTLFLTGGNFCKTKDWVYRLTHPKLGLLSVTQNPRGGRGLIGWVTIEKGERKVIASEFSPSELKNGVAGIYLVEGWKNFFGWGWRDFFMPLKIHIWSFLRVAITELFFKADRGRGGKSLNPLKCHSS